MNFIESSVIESELCNQIREFFEQSPDKFPGGFGEEQHDLIQKSSTECYLTGNLFDEYASIISILAQQYLAKYWPARQVSNIGISEQVKIQYYRANQDAYWAWHSERDSIRTCKRYLTFMTYLNTIDSGGETEFLYQQLKVKPVQGLTLFWPVDWTFTHRGLMSNQDKWITTGWFSFMN